MSDYRVTSGLMARLIEAVPEDDYEAISDRLLTQILNSILHMMVH
ncbi:UNVERIFIED_ORG: hypothetical protein [Escherichia phage CMSTMSU]